MSNKTDKSFFRTHPAVVIAAAILFLGVGYWVTGEGKQTENHSECVPLASGKSESAVKHVRNEEPLYICPMKCSPPTDKPGRCPACGMELVPVAKGDGHTSHPAKPMISSPQVTNAALVHTSSEETLYACPMKCVPPTNKPGKCPECGMNLTPLLEGDGHGHHGPAGIKLSRVAMKMTEMNEDPLYGCPMLCVPPTNKPGKCPVCGMDLVAIAAEEYHNDEGAPTMTVPAEKIRPAGIQVAPVERKFVTKEIRLFGKIEYDPVEQYKVTAFAPGIIDRIYVKRSGQMVRAGDPLFDMHSSELFVLEQDLFEVLKQFPDAVDYRPARGQIYKRQMRPPRRQFNLPKPGEVSKEDYEVKKAALEKLTQIQRKMRLLGLSKENIERIMARGLPSGISTVITPTTGIVQQQFAFKGSYVNTGETVFTIANPKYLWARLDGYAADFPWIRLGQEAEFQVDAFPGETFTGKVQYLDPEFDPQTRTFKVGVLYTDLGKRLRPNMLVRCVIHSTMAAGGVAAPGRKVKVEPPLVIPDTAPLITGNRAVVYVEVPGKPGTFEGREVVLGPRARGYYGIKQGLKAGEKVVVNGNFKIDSAVQILAKPSMMEHAGGETMAMHSQHVATPAMDMQMKTEPPSTTPQRAKSAPSRRDQIKERLMKLKPKSR